MGTFERRAAAIGILAAAALSPASPSWATFDLAMTLAGPTSQEETIYRPECPSDETSNGPLTCRVAGPREG